MSNYYNNNYQKKNKNDNWTFVRNDNHKVEYDDNTASKNFKKILCKNINSVGKCIYTNKCLYAHSLDDQNVEPIRAMAYKMIKSNDDLSEIDLTKNKQLYSNLLTLTKLCQHCEQGICTGGYNCKHGACDKIYVVCQTDLTKGTCEGKCGYIHLTNKGLVPHAVKLVRNMKTKIPIPKATIINDDFFKKLNENIINIEQQYTDSSDDDKRNINIEKEENIKWDTMIDNYNKNNYSDSSEDESYILNKLQLDKEETDDTFLNKEKKLNSSIFKIDILCI